MSTGLTTAGYLLTAREAAGYLRVRLKRWKLGEHAAAARILFSFAHALFDIALMISMPSSRKASESRLRILAHPQSAPLAVKEPHRMKSRHPPSRRKINHCSNPAFA